MQLTFVKFYLGISEIADLCELYVSKAICILALLSHGIHNFIVHFITMTMCPSKENFWQKFSAYNLNGR